MMMYFIQYIVTNSTESDVWLIKFNRAKLNSVAWLGLIGFGYRTSNQTLTKIASNRMLYWMFEHGRLYGDSNTWLIC